jgi:hypothetical protein
MHTKDAIKFALTLSNGAVLSVIDEMSGAATTFPTPNGGCHPLWVLGHLTLIEQRHKRPSEALSLPGNWTSLGRDVSSSSPNPPA